FRSSSPAILSRPPLQMMGLLRSSSRSLDCAAVAPWAKIFIGRSGRRSKCTIAFNNNQASGFGEGGSGGDILRSSASEGALNRAVLVQQGHITEAGYQEQADSYTAMQT